jgi:hypothetical protein
MLKKTPFLQFNVDRKNISAGYNSKYQFFNRCIVASSCVLISSFNIHLRASENNSKKNTLIRNIKDGKIIINIIFVFCTIIKHITLCVCLCAEYSIKMINNEFLCSLPCFCEQNTIEIFIKDNAWD